MFHSSDSEGCSCIEINTIWYSFKRRTELSQDKSILLFNYFQMDTARMDINIISTGKCEHIIVWRTSPLRNEEGSGIIQTLKLFRRNLIMFIYYVR